MSGNKQIVTEIGRAFALLGLYILLLLTPLHQAAGLQRDLAALGYETAASWSVCAPLAEKSGDEAPLLVKCPAQHLGSHYTPPAGATDHAPDRVCLFVGTGTHPAPILTPLSATGSGGSRAPPALV